MIFVSFQASLMTSLDNAKTKYKNVCQEEDALTIKTAEQEKLIARIKTANKNLRHDDVTDSEFKDKFSQLTIELKKITDENAEIQQSVDKKQQQRDTYKRVQDEILKKQQNRTELQSKLNELKKENGDIKEELTKTRKSISDLKVRENLNDGPNLDIAKRLRLSSNTTTVSIRGKKISFSVFDLNSFCQLGRTRQLGTHEQFIISSFERFTRIRKYCVI